MRLAELSGRYTAGGVQMELTMNKKAQSHMWFIIIAAVAAIITLVVVVFLFTRGTQKAETSLSACETAGGECVGAGTCRDIERGTPFPSLECTEDGRPDPNKECCLGIKKRAAIT